MIGTARVVNPDYHGVLMFWLWLVFVWTALTHILWRWWKERDV